MASAEASAEHQKCDPLKEPLLIDAVTENNVTRSKELLSEGVNPNAKNALGLSLLMLATKQSSVELIQILLAYNADVNAIWEQHHGTALMIAGFEQDFASFDLLLKAGADVNVQDELGDTVLMQVISDNFEHFCARLEADINFRPHSYKLDLCNISGQTAMHLAVDVDNVTMVMALVSAGANPQVPGPKNDPPLMHAQSSVVADALLTAGCNPNWADSGGRPCIDYAITNQVPAVASSLIRAGIDVNVTYSDGMTPLFRALTCWLSSIVEELVDHGADVMAKDSKNRGALYFASVFPDAFTCEYLLAKGADPDLVAWDHTTPVYMAVSRHHTAVAKVLLAHHVRLDRLYPWDGRHVTLLDMAISEQLEDLCGLLYELGCPVMENYNIADSLCVPPAVGHVIMRLREPRHLQASCRIIIRQRLMMQTDYLSTLCIPAAIKDYILMSLAMLTPAFELSQDATTITILIKAPFAKISDTEIFIDSCDFKFYSKPYYLRLNLPGKIVENGAESAKYDVEKGHFTVVVPKATPGEQFNGLDMLTRLMAPAGKESAKAALIEVLGSKDMQGDEVSANEVEDDDAIDWQIEQQLPEETIVGLNDPAYGFANQRSGVFKQLQSELHGVIDLQDADGVPASKRRQLRMQHEDAHFEDEHYLADLYENEGVKQVLAYCPRWVHEYNQVHAGASPEDVVALTDDLKEKMLKLPRKEYLLDKTAQKEALLGLVDLMFAYAYNHRTTEGDSTVESSWAITKLSTMLCWLETPMSVQDAVVASIRRSLCFPIYRSWKLAKRLLKDVQHIFITGRRCILRCLLELHTLLQDTDSRYILNDLYITDYCVWVQSVSDKHIRSLAKTLSEVNIQKSDVGFDLELLEHAASLALEENERSGSLTDITSDMQNLSLQSEHGNVDATRPPQGAALGHSGSGDECSSEEDSDSEYETDSSKSCTSDSDETPDETQCVGQAVVNDATRCNAGQVVVNEATQCNVGQAVLSDAGLRNVGQDAIDDSGALSAPQGSIQNMSQRKVLIEDITEVP